MIKKFKILIIFLLTIFCINLNFSYSNNEEDNYLIVNKTSVVNILSVLTQFENIEVYNSNGVITENISQSAKTGMYIIADGVKYKFVVNGDINGDGEIDEKDYLLLKQYRVDLITLENEYKKAINTNTNDVSLIDLSIEKKNLAQKEIPDVSIIYPERIDLENTQINININESFKLEATIYPDNAENKEILWFSNDYDIATIDEDGIITGISNGSTLIVGYTENDITALCNVTVSTSPEEIKFDTSQIELSPNDEKTLQVLVTPQNSNTNLNLKWTNSNPEVANIDEYGKITAKTNGETIITATTENDKSTSCKVIVNTNPENIELNNNILTVKKDETAKLEAFVYPITSNINTDIEWHSYDEDIASVDENGLITANNVGRTRIVAKTKNDKIAYCDITVYDEIRNLNFNISKKTLDLSSNNNEFYILATDQNGIDITNVVKWSSSNTDIATVENGLVKGLTSGIVTISAKTSNNLIANCEVTINISPISLSFNETHKTIFLADNPTFNLDAKILPENSNINTNITWSSSNEDVATVNNGVISAVNSGNTRIYAFTENGKSAYCDVQVYGEFFIQPSSIIIKQSEQTQLLTNTAEDSIIWKSNDSQIATIDSNGIVTGINFGSTTIEATNSSGKTAICNVSVYENITSISLSSENITLDLTQKPEQHIYAYSNNDINISSNVTWQSSNEEIATISDNGKLVAKQNGSCTITASIDSLYKEATVIVQTSPESISLSDKALKLIVNGSNSKQLTTTILPNSTTANQNVTWQSSNEDIATVSDSGVVHAISNGTTTITATTENGKSSSCEIAVQTQADSITINASNSYININGTLKLATTISPSTANLNTNITWSSDNENIATVDNTGKVTGKSAGTATITATTANNKSSSYIVNVVSLNISTSNTTIDISQNKTVELSVSGKNYGNITWSSNNTSIATVSNTGIVTGIKNGNVNIYATESNGNVKATISIIVKTSITNISLNKTSLSLDIASSSSTLKATITPSTASSTAITWSSSNTNVATVNSSGKITRVGEGTTTITATAKDGSKKKATATVTVKKEKLIIVGASTVNQLANRSKISSKSGDYANINYYLQYGYTVRSTSSWSKEYYSYLSKKSESDTGADLFFVSKGGEGYQWLVDEKNLPDYFNPYLSGSPGEGNQKIERILSNNPNCHFTVAIMNGGNDLTLAKSETQVTNIATKYAAYFYKLAKKYPNHTFYGLSINPADPSHSSSSTLKQTGYNVANSNNTKRAKFASKLKSTITSYNCSNLKYLDMYSYYKTGAGKDSFITYDGKHYNKNTCKLVLERILKQTGVLDSSNKKK